LDGTAAKTIVELALAESGSAVELTALAIDHRRDNGPVNAQVAVWARAQRHNHGAAVLYFDVSPPAEVRTAMLEEWVAGSVVRMHVGDHHVSEQAAVETFLRHAEDAKDAPKPCRLTVTWGHEASGQAGCTLAANWVRYQGFRVPHLNRRVLQEIAAADTTGKPTLFTRYANSDAAATVPFAELLTCSDAEFTEFERRGQALVEEVRRDLLSLLQSVKAVTSALPLPSVPLYVVKCSDGRKATGLAALMWDPEHSFAPGVLLMRTDLNTASLRHHPRCAVTALDAARHLAERHSVRWLDGPAPYGGHAAAAGLTMAERDMDALFDTALEVVKSGV
jgi:hypothetical protein